MREILFRGKRADNGEWVEGNLFIPDCPDKPTEICIGSNVVRITYEVVPTTIGQFTGLTDKNGTKIFEGDILKNEKGTIYSGSYNCEVVFDSGMFFAEGFVTFSPNEFKLCEVIGNIHDNPELLEAKE